MKHECRNCDGYCSVFKTHEIKGRLKEFCMGTAAGVSKEKQAKYVNGFYERYLGQSVSVDSSSVFGSMSTPSNKNKTVGGCCSKGKTSLKPKRPIRASVSQMARSLVEAAKNPELTTRDVAEHRMSVCSECPMLTHTFGQPRCSECGCWVKPKTDLQYQYCPTARWHRQLDRRIPFDDSQVKRNLIMHVWPLKGSGVWQWNIDQILKRIDLFNGKRVVAIATGGWKKRPETDHPEVVMERLKGYGFDHFVVQNRARIGEMQSFPKLLDKVRSVDPNEMTFYCHTKGSKHDISQERPNEPVYKWTDSMYTTLLDDWPSVQNALESHTFAGSFKYYGMFKSAGNHRWHYSGTFYWFRHNWVFDHNWKMDSKYYGTESWPGFVCEEKHGACMFADDYKHGLGAYSNVQWKEGLDDEFARWKEARGIEN